MKGLLMVAVHTCVGAARLPIAVLSIFCTVYAFAESGLPPAGFPTRDAMWSLADAGREKTACREKISLNGLWAFKVDNEASDVSTPPKAADMHNFFKVPGKWPSGGKHSKNGCGVWDAQGRDHFGADVTSINGAWYARTVDVHIRRIREKLEARPILSRV